MMEPRSRLHLLAAALLLLAGSASGAGVQIPEGPGSNLVYAKCQTCHDLQYVADAKGLLPAQWKAVLASMSDYGMEISDQEKSTILTYLTTYLGPNPPPAKPEAPAARIDGKAVFQQSCATCHGANGQGQPGYFPPLVGNPDLFEDNLFPVLVVLNGLSGPITVEGQSYNGSMPAFDHLSNAEIAAVVNFVRDAWENGSKASHMKPIAPELVAQQRNHALSPSEMHARREKMESK
ncbi:MAG TPA: cytochrome c [Candidatus Binataceae bacterium]|nr:cytochrome c [Candidatus Binataceae bacterium]